jgi:hypothetical protein
MTVEKYDKTLLRQRQTLYKKKKGKGKIFPAHAMQTYGEAGVRVQFHSS